MSTTMDRQVSVSSALLPSAPTYGVRGFVARKVVERILRGVPVTVRLSTGEVYGAPPAEHRPVLEVTRPEAFFARASARAPTWPTHWRRSPTGSPT